jgi:hypothetical protein
LQVSLGAEEDNAGMIKRALNPHLSDDAMIFRAFEAIIV